VSLEFSSFNGREIDLKVVEYERNKGKGGAVRIGMLIARGDNALMVDADGATRFSDILKLIKEMENISNKKDQGMVAGSRRHLM
jgi:dolichyl-phosphate beta-glucosyltransferase